jgi:FAD/FMN-containing dehydrogenase
MKNDNLISVYEIDASQTKGKATDIVQPKTVEEVQEMVKLYAHVCIRGGGSGLAGGCVPQNEVVLDLSKLDKIGELDTQRRTIEVEAGVVLGDLQDVLGKYGLEFPVNPSSFSICTIGGMIATDAVGSRAAKYGRTSEWVNWVEVINPKGEILRKGQTELSDYAGMEGITGVIVRASLKLATKKERTAKLVSTDDLKEIYKLVLESKQNSEISMVEFMDKKISEMIGLEKKYHLIIEYENEQGNLYGKDYERLMEKRYKLYPMLAEHDYHIIEDPKIMLGKFEDLMEWFEKKNIPVFGHISVGIIHPCFKKEQKELVSELLRYVPKISGKITGEHGVGLLKKEFVDSNDKKLLMNIKKRTDPRNKFNQGKII